MFQELHKFLDQNHELLRLLEGLRDLKPGETIVARGISGSLDAFVIASLQERAGRQILYVARDRESALRITDDLRGLTDSPSVKMFLPDHRTGAPYENKIEDVDSLRALAGESPSVVVTLPSAFLIKLPPQDVLKNLILTIQVDEEQSFAGLIQSLTDFRFTRKEFVEGIGDFSVRGGILDIYSFGSENPVRIEFFGDRVESLREFDVLSQRSIQELAQVTVVPDLMTEQVSGQESSSLVDFLASDSVLISEDKDLFLADLMDDHQESGDESRNIEMVRSEISSHPILVFSSLGVPVQAQADFHALPQPAFNGSIRFLRDHIQELAHRGFRIIFGCESQSELRRLKDLLLTSPPSNEEDGAQVQDGGNSIAMDLNAIGFVQQSLHQGFLLPDDRIAFYTEHQIFGRRKRRGKRRRHSGYGLSAHAIQQLRKGDYVVHADYGIGRFDGLKKVRVQRFEHEVLRVVYDGGDILYVNLNYVSRVQKYSSKEGHTPKLTKLGSSEWQSLKSRAKKRIKDIARDLIQLYSQRKKTEGFAFLPDTPWQKEMEAAFVFEDTFDQAKATLDVKQDMESSNPMDRLICGDVGFGKTEVAVRAAFKAVMNGKQVAVLVPTTILALQHFNTFVDRLSRYSVNVEALSRLKSKREQTEILGRLGAGTIDIIIGTHRILSSDVVFKDLGLLVVDEEHRFGVAAKEKLRQKKAAVDTITLTATPIPRTLHFSLMGARDLSIIATPPRNRLPIITEMMEFDEEKISDAVLREIHRGGQVYVVHDRVRDIAEFAERLRRTCPGTRMRFAHGQMPSRELEDVMVEFLEKKFDVLVCTKIIESGLDIPNVNTILIDRADRFGMAELYQLRGRVGRSNVQAYAYLITPPLASLPDDALQRLDAMREFTELGSGFHLAMRDLEIRGAGNLLGSEQSGFIESMGFETYTRILEEAVSELKEEEFKGLYEQPARISIDNTILEVDVDAFIPQEYVSGDEERLEMYRRLYTVTSEEQIVEIELELKDRFGALPREVVSLFKILRLRLEATRHGFRKIKASGKSVQIEFPPRADESFYRGDRFDAFLARISGLSGDSFHLSETPAGLSLRMVPDPNLEILDATLSCLRTAASFMDPLVALPTP